MTDRPADPPPLPPEPGDPPDDDLRGALEPGPVPPATRPEDDMRGTVVASSTTAIDRPDADATLVDLLDRVIDRGVVVTGDVVLSIAGVDLVRVGVNLVLSGIDGGLDVGAQAELGP